MSLFPEGHPLYMEPAPTIPSMNREGIQTVPVSTLNAQIGPDGVVSVTENVDELPLPPELQAVLIDLYKSGALPDGTWPAYDHYSLESEFIPPSHFGSYSSI